MSTSNHNPQRDFAEEVVAKLRNAGHEALFAGGCVRDELLGRDPKDYDVATSALPDEVREVFGKKRTLAIGAVFGVITVLGPRLKNNQAAGQIEVATFRSDANYTDGRRPDGVTFTNAEEDASRRDFTINGLFYDPAEEKVVDYVGGKVDLEAKVVRAIGDPEQRFAEDKLRMLRAVRFAATLGFDIAPATADAIRRHAEELEVVSAERIGAEVKRMLIDANRVRAIELLQEVGLWQLVFPELREATEEQTETILLTLGRLGKASLPLALAVLLRELPTMRAGIEAARRLRLTKREGEVTQWIVDNVGWVSEAADRPWSMVQPVLASTNADQAVALHVAVVGGEDTASRFCREKLALPREVLDPPPLVVGRDLIEHGVQPCAEFGAWLGSTRAAQLNGEITTKAEALALIDRLRQ